MCADRHVQIQLSRDSNGDLCEAVYTSQDEGSAEVLICTIPLVIVCCVCVCVRDFAVLKIKNATSYFGSMTI